MIKVTIIQNTTRTAVLVEDTATPKQVIAEQGINLGTAVMHLDSCPLTPETMNKSFADIGITDECLLVAVTKTNNN